MPLRDSSEVDVLLPLYDGARFLPELVASLASQTLKGFRLILRDDGSSDGSLALALRLAKDAGIPAFALDGGQSLGVSGSINVLVQASTAPYVMFCDQDDVWLPEKVATLLAAIKELEASLPKGAPAMAHCDLTVVDESLNVLRESMWRSQRLDATRRLGLQEALVQNSATGCAMIVNRPLLEAATPVPSEAVMHDWHLFIAAAALGGVKAVDSRLVLYRQHGANSVGFLDFTSLWGLFCGLRRRGDSPMDGVAALFVQAKGALRSIRGLPEDAAKTIETFASIPLQGWLSRRVALFKGGFLKGGLLRNLRFFLFV